MDKREWVASSAHGEAAGVGPAEGFAPAGGAGYFEAKFGIGRELVRRVLTEALGRGGDFADVYFQHKVSDFVGYEDGQVNRAYAQVDLGAGIRVLKGEQTGFAFTEELTAESLIAAARTAASIASSAAENAIPDFRAVGMPKMYSQKPLWLGIAPEKKIAIPRRIGEKMTALDAAVVKARAWFGDSDEAVLVANSEGLWAEDFRPMTTIQASCTAEKNGRIESNGYSRSARRGIDLYTEECLDEISKEAVGRTLLLFDAVVPEAGEMPVVLAPGSSGILLHEAMGHGFEADFNRKGVSIFSAMLNKQIAENFVTITDTALVPDSRGAANMDDEGCPGQLTTLVENGRLVSYLHDRISAKHYKTAQTGNGRRESFRSVPMPRMRVTAMENGPHSPEEIIRSVKKGLYAVDFSNGEVAIGAGDYSFYVKSGYLIEDGKLTTPVKDANLIGNGPDTLRKICMVGNDKTLDWGTWTCGKDGQSVPVGMGLPTVKVSSLTVGGVNR